MLYKTCPECGAHLDPGERCDCAKPAPRYHIKVTYHDGDVIETDINATPAEILELYPLGEVQSDWYKRFVELDLKVHPK